MRYAWPLLGSTLQAVSGWLPTITPQGAKYHSVTVLPLALWFSYVDNRPYGKGLIKTKSVLPFLYNFLFEIML
jgi:hypothetical protein